MNKLSCHRDYAVKRQMTAFVHKTCVYPIPSQIRWRFCSRCVQLVLLPGYALCCCLPTHPSIIDTDEYGEKHLFCIPYNTVSRKQYSTLHTYIQTHTHTCVRTCVSEVAGSMAILFIDLLCGTLHRTSS